MILCGAEDNDDEVAILIQFSFQLFYRATEKSCVPDCTIYNCDKAPTVSDDWQKKTDLLKLIYWLCQNIFLNIFRNDKHTQIHSQKSTFSRSVRSQVTAISFSIEKDATLKDSVESSDCIASATSC